MITFLSDAGFAPIANHVETSRTRTTIGATRRQTPGKAFWSLRGLEFGHFKNYLVRPRGKADALLPSAGRSGVSKASRLTLLPEASSECPNSRPRRGAVPGTCQDFKCRSRVRLFVTKQASAYVVASGPSISRFDI